MAQLTVQTDLGPVCIRAEGEWICGVGFARDGALPGGDATPLLLEAKRQLAAYLAGEAQSFSLPIRASGTPFQQAVWQALRAIPYGQVRSYGQIAASINRPGAARAVGRACNKNPVAILIPCHRVVGASGCLVGYAYGLARKEKLLRLEKQTVNCSQIVFDVEKG